MSFSRMPYDEGAYQHYLKETTGSGSYMLQTPRIDCQACFYPSPHVRIDKNGARVCDRDLIDVDSELMGLSRKDSKCPTQKYLPREGEFCTSTPMRDCHGLDPEETRISNPPCTLRSTGWNRWEWLACNPQDKAMVPFQYLINNQQIVKDNHRACIPRPLDQSSGLPAPQPADNGMPCGLLPMPAQLPMQVIMPDQMWQRCDVIAKY